MTQNAAAPDDTLDFKRVLPIFLVVLVDLLGLTIIIPLLPLYATTFGADPQVIGLLGATYPIMQFIGAPLLGRLSDRYGRKPVLIASQIGTLIGFVILGFANALWLLFLSRIIDGLSGANISTAQAMIADSTTEKTRTQGLALVGAAFGLGFIIGPMLAGIGLAVSGNNYNVPAFLAAGFSLVSILISIFMLKETHDTRTATGATAGAFSFGSMIDALRRPQIGILLALLFTQQVAFGGLEQILSLFTLNRLGMNASGNAALFVFVGILVVLVQGYFIRQWSRKWGDRTLINIGLVALALGLLLTALTPAQPVPWYSRAELQAELSRRPLTSEPAATQQIAVGLPDDGANGWLGLAWLMLAMIPASIGGGILQPSINSLITKRSAAGERGGVLGIGAAFLSAANALAPVMGGLLFSRINASAPLLTWTGLTVLLFLIAWVMLPARTDDTQAAPIAAAH